MKTITFTCDLCAEPCTGDLSVLAVKAGTLVTALPDELHVCGACGRRLLEFLRTKPTPSETTR